MFSLAVEAQVTFQKVFSYGGMYDGATAIEQTTDGGYIVGGVIKKSAMNSDACLVKVDGNGDTLWAKTYGGSGSEAIFSLQQTTEGGYILAGRTYSYGAGDADIYLIKTDSNGDTVWTRAYGGANDELAVCVQQTTDGGYVIAGRTTTFGPGVFAAYVVKTDSLGDTLWTRSYGGWGVEAANWVEQTNDGGYIITGLVQSFSGPVLNFIYLIKTDANGDTLWTRQYGGTNSGDEESGLCVKQTMDGGYIVTGSSESFAVGVVPDAFLMKTDGAGNMLWAKTYGTPDAEWGSRVEQLADKGFIVVGGIGSFQQDVYVIRTDSVGDTLWTRAYGGVADDWANDLAITQDGGFIIAASTESFGLGGEDFYLIKMDSLGNSGCNERSTATVVANAPYITTLPATEVSGGAIITNMTDTVGSPSLVIDVLCFEVGEAEADAPDNAFLIYPNPATERFTIEGSYALPAVLELYDVMGRKVKEFEVTPFDCAQGAKKFTVDVQGWSKGIYLYRLMDAGGGVVTGKVVVE